MSAATAVARPAGAIGRSARKPNIIFILADDLGAFDLSCYGRSDYTTPNIDSLAQDGMLFDLGYANSSTCTPTRTALMSGRYQNRLQVGTGIGGDYTSDTIGYPADIPSMPSILRRAGYRTALIGKWGLGEPPTFSPNKSGYSEFFGLMGGGFDYWSHDIGNLRNPGAARRPDLYENERPVAVVGYATDLFSDRACDFIRRAGSQPFLLSLHYNAPHWPWQTRDDKAQNRQNDLHFDGGSPSIFGAMVKAMDDGIGKVLDVVSEQGLREDTVVVFTSDNGGERFSRMWPLRGAKGDLWEGGVRVPLIVRWPGRIDAGSRSAQVAMSMDFVPTFAALAGVNGREPILTDGLDIKPQLLGAAPVDRTVFWKSPGAMVSALAYPWKYLRIGEREFLYDLRNDPSERANLKSRSPSIFAHLKEQASIWAAQMLPDLGAPPPGLLDRLEALVER